MNDPRTLVQNRLSHNKWGLLDSQGAILGLDVGSYGLRAALADLQKHTYTSIHQEITFTNPQEVVAHGITLGQTLLEQHQITSGHVVRIGVGFAGPVDARSGITLLSHRMQGWERLPLCSQIEEAFGAVTLLDNDANLIALAEATFGVAQGVQHLFYLHLSSGVGGGLVLDGRLYHGATTTAGEIGHAIVGQYDPLRPGEAPGTLEQHLSIKGLLSRAAALGFETNLLSDIFSDHPVGRQVTAEAVEMLAVTLSQIVALVDPQIIVLGGAVTRSGGQPFLDAIQTRMRTYTSPLTNRSVQIVASVLGYESVAIGGLALALESMRD